jgi:Bacterial PH domain
MASILPHAITGVAVVLSVRLVQQYLHDRKRATVQAVEGVARLRYGPVFRWLSAALLVVPSAGFSALAWANPAQTTSDTLAWVGLQAFFLLLGVPLVLEAFGVRHQVDRWGLHYRTPWSRERTIAWEDVREITWSESARWWVVTTYDGARARLPELLDGIDTFLEFARCYAPIEPALRKLAARAVGEVAELGGHLPPGAGRVVIR